jgi:DNA-binding transcriptional LysR family regulator
MDLLQLEHFLAVAEEGTFTRAAERVRRTQPAISQSIKKLEDELGMPLFTRDLHDVSLTEAGKALVDYARKMVRARDEALRTLGSLKHMSAGTLNIAFHESAAVYLLPAPLRHYLRRFPDIKVGPRQTFMIYRESGQHSNAARELIGVVRGFNWEVPSGARVRPIRKRAQAGRVGYAS